MIQSADLLHHFCLGKHFVRRAAQDMSKRNPKIYCYFKCFWLVRTLQLLSQGHH